MGQWKTMVREVISYELFYLVLQNQQCAWFSGKGIDLFLRMQQWWVSVKIRAAVFWGNKTDVSSALALLERFVMVVFCLVGFFGAFFLSFSFFFRDSCQLWPSVLEPVIQLGTTCNLIQQTIASKRGNPTHPPEAIAFLPLHQISCLPNQFSSLSQQKSVIVLLS